MTAPFPLEGASLLPHSGHARFVDEVLESGNDALVCVGRIPAENPFTRDGRVPGFVLVELAAQAAAIEALARMGGDGPRPRIGYLVRARGLNWTAGGVPAGAPLTVSVLREDSIPPLYMYRATVTLDGTEVLGGRFSIYVDDESG
jgi:predicted hotdog family 3-hydroxylacyl-ACP dehydratase